MGNHHGIGARWSRHARHGSGCAAREDGANVVTPAFREAFAAMVNEYAVADYQDIPNQSLEAFIAFFGTWYPYGDLNAESTI